MSEYCEECGEPEVEYGICKYCGRWQTIPAPEEQKAAFMKLHDDTMAALRAWVESSP